MLHFGEWLKRKIEEQLLKQDDFARRARIPYSTLRYWISSASPNVRGLGIEKLARTLKMDRAEIENVLAQSKHSATAA